MSITLNLDNVVAEELCREASAKSMTPEELAGHFVREAIEQRLAERQWQSYNRRRLELIAKKRHTSLTEGEQEEFNRLQEIACERAAPFDRELRRTAEKLQREIEKLHAESIS